MSWDIEEVDTSFRPRHQTVSMFRMEESRPFDPRMISLRFGAQPQTQPNPQPTAARARVNPMAYASPYDEDDEKVSLIRRRKGDLNIPLMTVCALATVIAILVVLMGIMYYQFTSSVTEARDLSRPYIMEAVNHTLSILHNIDHSTVSAHEMADGARDLTAAAVPALQHALNQSALIVDRLERLARNPVLQLSLQNTG